MGCPRFMRIYSVLPNIFGGQSVDQFGLTATAVYRFPSCPAAALPLIFQTQKSIRLFACKTTMQTERLTVCPHTRFAGQKNNLYNGKG